MYLKKLEIVGFKSFLNKTILHFEPGVTAVVGPNGCGKSNIFDSMRWVLGEQSVKSLRGSDMQDVIFNGTDTKEPVSMAEVSLSFDNAGKFFSVDSGEVIITRRLFRSGESEYLLNKAVVRLKDITDLLAGTGIGAESYSLVEQGKIDLVLSSRPEDRRLVFDEAAGITKYKSQKREALRKLDETQQNLLRVNDIIIEVKRQIGSLERQANKARRYKEVFDELKTKELQFSALQKEKLISEKDQIIKQLSDLEAKEAELLKAIEEQDSRINNRQQELKDYEDKIMAIKNDVLSLDNQIVRNGNHIDFSKEKISELQDSKKYLESQVQQVKDRLFQDEEKLGSFKKEYDNLNKNIEEKTLLLKDNENKISTINTAIKDSLDKIAQGKKDIMELAVKIANARNGISELGSKQHVYLARKKRLEVEQAKINEEKALTQENLEGISKEVSSLNEAFSDSIAQMDILKKNSENEAVSLAQITEQIEDAKRQLSALESQKEFLEKLKNRYDDINESMNAVIYLDKLPTEKTNGLVIKIKSQEGGELKFSGEAKPIDLDAQKITELIQQTINRIALLTSDKQAKGIQIEGLNKNITALQDSIRSQEINLANKKTSQNTLMEQFNKIKEEEQIIAVEISDIDNEISGLRLELSASQQRLAELESQNTQRDSLIAEEQQSVNANGLLREGVLVIITQTKTELDALMKRFDTDESTFNMLESAYNQDKETLLNLERQIDESTQRKAVLEKEIADLEQASQAAGQLRSEKILLLGEEEAKYKDASSSANQIIKVIDANRKELDAIKDALYQLQMRDKDIDFKYQSIKDRIQQVYKIEFDSYEGQPQPVTDENALAREIDQLKSKVDSYGNVNLVAIEEYDELKKRYDFLTEQQGDLNSSREALQEAIQKINRTTKKMFLETFEKVQIEFRNYFRLLFNGGDCQIFLIDEQDPLESGIEIICRPPGKKLQNVLLLSGGEKSMSAIALIFAIFKVKPSPFCVLDEIDAALDEANVDRFGRMLQEFTSASQFIVITHNKKTIANATVMYGITMEESGVSKIVSVKFARDNKATKAQDKEPDLVVA